MDNYYKLEEYIINNYNQKERKKMNILVMSNKKTYIIIQR